MFRIRLLFFAVFVRSNEFVIIIINNTVVMNLWLIQISEGISSCVFVRAILSYYMGPRWQPFRCKCNVTDAIPCSGIIRMYIVHIIIVLGLDLLYRHVRYNNSRLITTAVSCAQVHNIYNNASTQRYKHNIIYFAAGRRRDCL